ncbi:hypothetical protein [Alteromonas pelagimontana]|nr:hypothetical protein [Alteromonas pelagimontana]
MEDKSSDRIQTQVEEATPIRRKAHGIIFVNGKRNSLRKAGC